MARTNRDEYQWMRHLLSHQQNVRAHLPVRHVAKQCKKTRNALIALNLVLIGLIIVTVVQTVRIV